MVAEGSFGDNNEEQMVTTGASEGLTPNPRPPPGKTGPTKRRWRKPISCDPCRHSKLKCDRRQPCSSCKRRSCEVSCDYTAAGKQSKNHIQKQHVSPQNRGPDYHTTGGVGPASPQLPSPLSLPPITASIGASSYSQSHVQIERFPSRSPFFSEITPIIPDEQQRRRQYTNAHWDALLQRPIDQMDHPTPKERGTGGWLENPYFPFPLGPSVSKDELVAMVPSDHCCDYLVTQYFTRLSALFHILHGPTFQKQYNAFRQDRSNVDLSWLALLLLICSATLNTMGMDDILLADLLPLKLDAQDIPSISYQFRAAAMVCLSHDQFLIRHNMSTLEGLLILIYTISNNEGVEQAWTLLGLALNMAIALQCNVDHEAPLLNCIEIQRRRRCWAGILMLHTYQAISFRDVDISTFLSVQVTMPADVNDDDICEDAVCLPSSQPSQMSVMRFKIQLFQLSSKICRHLSSPLKYAGNTLALLNEAVAHEQEQWDTVFLLDGRPSVLDTSSYAHWCILQLYVHQLYLLLHRPFCKSRSAPFRATSRQKCVTSGASLLEIHREFCDLPRLRHYRWLVYGMTSFYAIHGALALASCLLDDPNTFDMAYRTAFNAAVARFDQLQAHSQICAKAGPILHHLQ